jgi:hypothetical protein
MIAQAHRSLQDGQMPHGNPLIIAVRFANQAITLMTPGARQRAFDRDDTLPLRRELRLQDADSGYIERDRNMGVISPWFHEGQIIVPPLRYL